MYRKSLPPPLGQRTKATLLPASVADRRYGYRRLRRLLWRTRLLLLLLLLLLRWLLLLLLLLWWSLLPVRRSSSSCDGRRQRQYVVGGSAASTANRVSGKRSRAYTALWIAVAGVHGSLDRGRKPTERSDNTLRGRAHAVYTGAVVTSSDAST